MSVAHETRMSLYQKRIQLIKFAQSVMNDKRYSNEFDLIFSKLQISKKEVIESFLEYNLDIYSLKGNEVYESLANRIVLHIHNLLEGSWHIDRQQIILDMINLAQPNKVADIGFGVPSRYVKELVIGKNNFHLTLGDLYDSAFVFAQVLLQSWDESWEKKIEFKKTDMDKNEFIGNFDLYILQDSIEHVEEPDKFLRRYVQLAPENAKFLISLPIGPLIPRHFIAWETEEDVLKWLIKHELSIIKRKPVYVRPEVDLFADEIDPNYCDLIALCTK